MMTPLKARLAGAGAALGTVVGAIALWGASSACQVANAQSVCFTTPAGCYCVDFFLTDVKEKLIEEMQEKVTNKILEQEFLSDIDVRAIVGAVGKEITFGGLNDIGLRDEVSKDQKDRDPSLIDSAREEIKAIIDRDPDITSDIARRAYAIAGVHYKPDSMMPYTIPPHINPVDGSKEAGRIGENSDDVATWTDRLMLAPEPITLPDDDDLAKMRIAGIDEYYEETRNALGANIARKRMQELHVRQERLTALKEMRDRLDAPMEAIGAAETAQIHMEMLDAAVRYEQLQAELRREAAFAALLAIKMGNDDDNELPK